MTEVFATRHLSKSYGGIPALRDVSFSLGAGEIRAICGENGAGKSTFVKIVMGIVASDAGSIHLNGGECRIASVHQAQQLGLGLVAQELSLAPHLSILDNIWLGGANVPFFHRRSDLRRRAQDALGMLGIEDWDLDRIVGELTVGQRQLVEIARLLARDSRILILDEPTATLSDIEIGRLMQVLRTLRQSGRSIIYISHRLGEVFELCDSVSVFRNGEHIVTRDVAAVDRESLIEDILGRSFQDMYPPKQPGQLSRAGELVVTGLSIPGVAQDISFRAPRGKIVCIAGQVGSGATDVTRAVAGLIEQARGAVTLDGKPIPLGSVRQAFANEVIFVPEDRASEGVFLSLQVARNLVATRLPEYARAGFVASKVLRRVAEALAGRVGVVHTRLRAKARELSGGNQQKVVFARAVERQRTGILLMNEPTRGIDVGARADIYKLMRGLCAAGYSLVMTSSDLEEVVGMADIVFTMYRGRIVARYEDGEIAMATILRDIAHPPPQRDAA